MKTFILMMGFALMTISCSTQIYLEPAVLESVVQQKEFKFNATKAFPTNGQVLGVMNSMSMGGSSRLLNLDPGYGFVLDKDVFESHLPYFGRAYSSQYNSNDGGIKFTSNDFSVNQSKTKKGNTLLVVKTNDLRVNYTFNIEIFKNGSSFVSIDSNDRQPISFDGNISKIPN